MFRNILIFFTLLIAYQTYSQEKVLTNPVDSSKLARIIFYREAAYAGHTIRYSIFLDKKHIVELKAGFYFECYVEEGQHTLTCNSITDNAYSNSFSGGETYYINIISEPGLLTPKIRLQPEDQKIAKDICNSLIPDHRQDIQYEKLVLLGAEYTGSSGFQEVLFSDRQGNIESIYPATRESIKLQYWYFIHYFTFNFHIAHYRSTEKLDDIKNKSFGMNCYGLIWDQSISKFGFGGGIDYYTTYTISCDYKYFYKPTIGLNMGMQYFFIPNNKLCVFVGLSASSLIYRIDKIELDNKVLSKTNNLYQKADKLNGTSLNFTIGLAFNFKN